MKIPRTVCRAIGNCSLKAVELSASKAALCDKCPSCEGKDSEASVPIECQDGWTVLLAELTNRDRLRRCQPRSCIRPYPRIRTKEARGHRVWRSGCERSSALQIFTNHNPCKPQVGEDVQAKSWARGDSERSFRLPPPPRIERFEARSHHAMPLMMYKDSR